jgi:hypothetical protein
MTDTASAQLATLAQALQAFERGDHTAAALSTLARQQTTLLAALPPRYSEVLLNLLDRLESSALFSEESCSFSQKDLVGPRWTRAPQVARSEAQGRRQWGRLFFAYFLLAKQKKVTAPPGAQPGSRPWQRHAAKY